ncbi:uncharacterized protein MONBRDRAFT_38185 [Monosiga brevicollis MX1]|uniref:JmjC domain-containing protein n=1 Tax=Monosiga brevicollis TaxID=81824 RepID=A9V665_MONBE|nr:uncharacterized protein MONBRDRAFT_38185 [Monosiga brevicollis MX1]EDQ87017.1 predicted protein [Monosiga brevicollis MX1]|eukprot:XP_001748256.1 hypothetical protein [Monosiga brevicollis MX1]
MAGGVICQLCGQLVVDGHLEGAAGERAQRKHAKSRPHKIAVKSVVQAGAALNDKPVPLEKACEDRLDGPMGEDLAPACSLCVYFDGEYPARDAFPWMPEPAEEIESASEDESSVETCPHIAPDFAGRPRRRLLTAGRPFWTLQGVGLSELEDTLQELHEQMADDNSAAAPTAAEELLALAQTLYRSSSSRLPNVDVENERQCLSGHQEAQEIVQEAVYADRRCWATFEYPRMTHPSWWFPASVHVPTYDQVILSHRDAHIGCHRDIYAPRAVPVHTYLTALRGRKRVMLLPPETTWAADWDDVPATHADLLSLRRRVAQAGGYLFDLHAVPEELPTLFIPANWWHWLCPVAEGHAVLYGGSAFP